MKSTTILIAALALTFTACNFPGGGEEQAVKPQPREQQNTQPTQVGSEQSMYTNYSSGVLGNGQQSVLFFHAEWCPNCKEKNQYLMEWYGEETFPVNTYKVDFDTATELKQEFGITMQDIFVLVDGRGEMVTKLTAPSSGALKRLLYGNVDAAQAADGGDMMMNDGTIENDSMIKNGAMEEEAMMEDDTDTQAMVDTEVQGEFTVYQDGVLADGRAKVLFFHAEWCPKCQANTMKLNEWYGAESFPRSVYKIDYDTATALKQQYGVTGQDTFILVDGDGQEIERTTFPSEAKLRELLG